MQITDCRLRIGELLGRSAVYRALSILFRPPEGETAHGLGGGDRRLPEILESLEGKSSQRTTELARRLMKELEGISPEEWRRLYERIFGHAVHSTAPPYELEYGQEHSHRQPRELSDITAFYQAFGLQVSVSAHERADHILTECEFMAFLLYKEAVALDEGAAEKAELCREASRQFLSDHLGQWGPAFASGLSRAASGTLLGSISDLLLAWLAGECQRMKIASPSVELALRTPQEANPTCASCENQGSVLES